MKESMKLNTTYKDLKGIIVFFYASVYTMTNIDILFNETWISLTVSPTDRTCVYETSVFQNSREITASITLIENAEKLIIEVLDTSKFAILPPYRTPSDIHKEIKILLPTLYKRIYG